MTAVMKVAPFAFCLALTLQACLSKELTTGSIAPPSPATWEAEAERLIRTLDLPAHLQESAREYTAKQITRGTAPKPALEQWIAEQRDRGGSSGVDGKCRLRTSASHAGRGDLTPKPTSAPELVVSIANCYLVGERRV